METWIDVAEVVDGAVDAAAVIVAVVVVAAVVNDDIAEIRAC